MTTIYQDKGYKSRKDYLESLAEGYNCPLETVIAISDALSFTEDFDGLINALEDYYDEYY